MRAFIFAIPILLITTSCSTTINKRTSLRQMPPAFGPMMDLNSLNNPHKSRGY